MGLMRIKTTVRQNIVHTFYADGAAVDAGDVTVTLRRLDGTLVETLTASKDPTTFAYTYSFPPSAVVDCFTVDWTGDVAGATVTARDVIEVVGDFYFTIREARESHSSLRDTNKYSDVALATKRIQVEQECERIRRQAQVPRFARVVLDGTGTRELVLPDYEVRKVRAVSTASGTGAVFVALGAGSLAYIAPYASGVLVRTDDVWPYGYQNVIVEYEYGLDMPDMSIKDAALSRLRYLISASRSGIPDRALTWTTNEGGTYRLTTAGPKSTGDPDVDAAYLRDANQRVWIA